MLRRKPKESGHIRPVLLYLDDVKLIYDQLNDVCNEIGLGTEDYTVDSFEDLTSYPDRRIKGLGISGRDPHVGVTFSGLGARVYEPYGGAEAVALTNTIRDFLLSRRRPVVRS